MRLLKRIWKQLSSGKIYKFLMRHPALGGVFGIFIFSVANDIDHLFPYSFGHFIVTIFFFFGFGLGLLIFKIKKEVEKCSLLHI